MSTEPERGASEANGRYLGNRPTHVDVRMVTQRHGNPHGGGDGYAPTTRWGPGPPLKIGIVKRSRRSCISGMQSVEASSTSSARSSRAYAVAVSWQGADRQAGALFVDVGGGRRRRPGRNGGDRHADVRLGGARSPSPRRPARPALSRADSLKSNTRAAAPSTDGDIANIIGEAFTCGPPVAAGHGRVVGWRSLPAASSCAVRSRAEIREALAAETSEADPFASRPSNSYSPPIETASTHRSASRQQEVTPRGLPTSDRDPDAADPSMSPQERAAWMKSE